MSLEKRVVPSGEKRCRTVGVVVFAWLVAVPAAQADGLPNWAVRSAVSGAFAAQMLDATTTYRNLSHPCACYTELKSAAAKSSGRQPGAQERARVHLFDAGLGRGNQDHRMETLGAVLECGGGRRHE